MHFCPVPTKTLCATLLPCAFRNSLISRYTFVFSFFLLSGIICETLTADMGHCLMWWAGTDRFVVSLNTLMVWYESYKKHTQDTPALTPLDPGCVSRKCVGRSKPRCTGRFVCPSIGPCLLYRCNVLSLLGNSKKWLQAAWLAISPGVLCLYGTLECGCLYRTFPGSYC